MMWHFIVLVQLPHFTLKLILWKQAVRDDGGIKGGLNFRNSAENPQ